MTLFFTVALPCIHSRAIRGQVNMARRRNVQKRKGPSPTPPERKAELAKIAREFGVLPAQPGQDLDKKYSEPNSETAAKESTLYLALAGLIGVDTLATLEVGTYFVLGGLLTALITLGLAISSAAFYKAVEKPVPDVLDSFLNNAEPLFTPTVVLFLILSSILGIYKQSQLNSGVTGYDDRTR